MVYGIGTDIVSIKRGESPENMREVCTPGELALIAGRAAPACAFATRLAGKSAVRKALGRRDLPLDAIEILEDAAGVPTVALLGPAEELGPLRVELSLSYEDDCAIAFALAVK